VAAAMRDALWYSVAVSCSVLQCVAVRGSVLQLVVAWQRRRVMPFGILLLFVAECCSVLQGIAVCGSVLQCGAAGRVAACCSVLQHGNGDK